MATEQFVPDVPTPTEAMVVPVVGEVIEPTDTQRVMEALLYLREWKRDELNPFIAALEQAVLAYAMDVEAAYTIRRGGLVASSSSPQASRSYQYDGAKLRRLLAKAGLPKDQIEYAVRREVSFRVDAARIKMLAQHPVYGAVVEECRTEIPKRRSVTVKRDG